jgi:hypothetical protein
LEENGNLLSESSATSGGRMAISYTSPDEVRRKMKLDYVKTKLDPANRAFEGLQTLICQMMKPKLNARDYLQDCANFIQKHFGLRWVTIGLRNPADNIFRYELHSGVRPEAWAIFRQKAYKLDAFTTFSDYKAEEISRLSRVYLEEENPLNGLDQQATNRPALLSMRRRSADTSLEADFVDTLIVGPDEELLGWIEYSGTVSGKLPDSMTIRCVEIVSCVLSFLLTSKTRRQ